MRLTLKDTYRSIFKCIQLFSVAAFLVLSVILSPALIREAHTALPSIGPIGLAHIHSFEQGEPFVEESYCRPGELDFFEEEVCGQITFLAPPVVGQDSPFKLRFVAYENREAVAFESNELYVYLWMKMGGHEHGSAPVELRPTERTGEFLVSNVYFVMKGQWQVRVRMGEDAAKHPEQEEQTYFVSVKK